MKDQKHLTVGQVVEQLLRLDQDAVLTISLSQYNKRYGYHFHIDDRPCYGDKQERINSLCSGACIEISLPYGAFISKWPEKDS